MMRDARTMRASLRMRSMRIRRKSLPLVSQLFASAMTKKIESIGMHVKISTKNQELRASGVRHCGCCGRTFLAARRRAVPPTASHPARRGVVEKLEGGEWSPRCSHALFRLESWFLRLLAPCACARTRGRWRWRGGWH